MRRPRASRAAPHARSRGFSTRRGPRSSPRSARRIGRGRSLRLPHDRLAHPPAQLPAERSRRSVARLARRAASTTDFGQRARARARARARLGLSGGPRGRPPVAARRRRAAAAAEARCSDGARRRPSGARGLRHAGALLAAGRSTTALSANRARPAAARGTQICEPAGQRPASRRASACPSPARKTAAARARPAAARRGQAVARHVGHSAAAARRALRVGPSCAGSGSDVLARRRAARRRRRARSRGLGARARARGARGDRGSRARAPRPAARAAARAAATGATLPTRTTLGAARLDRASFHLRRSRFARGDDGGAHGARGALMPAPRLSCAPFVGVVGRPAMRMLCDG